MHLKHMNVIARDAHLQEGLTILGQELTEAVAIGITVACTRRYDLCCQCSGLVSTRNTQQGPHHTLRQILHPCQQQKTQMSQWPFTMIEQQQHLNCYPGSIC